MRIPTLAYNANTTIRLYYGNPSASDWSNTTGVWDTNYKLVQHLEESCASANCIKDSTANNNDGTPYSGEHIITNLYTPSGKIDGADSFDGTNDYVDAGSNTVLDNLNDFTVSAWVKPFADSWQSDWGTYYGAFAAKGNTLSSVVGWEANVRKSATGTKYALHFAREFSTTELNYRSTAVLNIGEWYHLATVYYSSTKTAKLYINGIEVTYSEEQAGVGSVRDDSAETLQFGHRGPTDDLAPIWLKGLIEEVRISASARSGDWIKTSYDNQNSPSTFYSVGGEPQGAGGDQPVPELPTVILLAVGLVVLAGYVCIGRRRSKS